MATKHAHLVWNVPHEHPLWSLFERVDKTHQAESASVDGQVHHVRFVQYSEDFCALKVQLDTGLYALYQRTPSGAWEQLE